MIADPAHLSSSSKMNIDHYNHIVNIVVIRLQTFSKGGLSHELFLRLLIIYFLLLSFINGRILLSARQHRKL